MTNEDLIKAFTMKVNGYKSEVIAKEFNVTVTTLNNILRNVISSKNPAPSIYPKLNEYMLVNGYTPSDMSRLLGIQNNSFADFIKGRTKPFDTIVKVIGFTGLTFEEIFMGEIE